jgi:sugar-phosphatase
MSGADKVLEFLYGNGIPLAIASSSRMNFIKTIVKNHGLEEFFQLLWSVENEPVGKPHPGIFLSVAARMNVDPQKCVVFEDSVNGMLSAKAANMKVVAFLSDGNSEDTKYDIADMKLESFHNFGPREYIYLELLMKSR